MILYKSFLNGEREFPIPSITFHRPLVNLDKTAHKSWIVWAKNMRSRITTHTHVVRTGGMDFHLSFCTSGYFAMPMKYKSKLITISKPYSYICTFKSPFILYEEKFQTRCENSLCFPLQECRSITAKYKFTV